MPRSIVFVFLIGSLGCNDLCTMGRPPTCNARLPECQQQVLEIVRCMRGSAPERPPPISVITIPAFEEMLRAGADPTMMRALDWERALQLLGLIDPAADLFEASIDEALAGVLAFYSPEEKAIYLIERGMRGDSVVVLATLAHELVHAAQDEESDLGALLDGTETHEEDTVLRSMVEGEAMLYTQEASAWYIGSRLDELDWQSFYAEQVQQLGNALGTSPSPYFLLYGLVPYLLGGRWQTARWEQGDDALVRTGLSMPPESTAWLMVDPWEAGARTPSARVPRSCDPPPPPTGFVSTQEDEMGAPLVYAFLERWGMTHAEAWDLALHWTRDDLYVYAAPDGRVALAWRLVFDDTTTSMRVASQIDTASDLFRTGHAEGSAVLLTSDDPTVTAAWTWETTSPACAPPP